MNEQAKTKKPNFLLGKAERLMRKIPPPPIKPSKAHPRTFEQAQEHIAPKLTATVKEISKLPNAVCPNDEAVALVTLHPSYLAKTYFPNTILADAHLRPIGSRNRMVSPDAWAIKEPPDKALTSELFVAGKRKDFSALAMLFPTWTEASRAADDVRKIEDFRNLKVDDRLRAATSRLDAPFWEIVLHATALPESDYILDGFRDYLKSLGISVDLDERLHAEGLCFLPVRAPRSQIKLVAEYSFLRVAREMPRMRPIARAGKKSPSFKYALPDEDALDPTIRAVIFDGGTPQHPELKWVNRKKAKGIGTAVPELVEHGLNVTSAALFGPLKHGDKLPQPFCQRAPKPSQ